MSRPDRTDLLDLVSRLQHRVHILNMLADAVTPGNRDMGNAFGLMSEDMQGDLDVLTDGLKALEVVS